MLPNIYLQSGEPVAVELTYSPSAAEIINPCEGSLALAVNTGPAIENGDFTQGVDGWQVPDITLGTPGPGSLSWDAGRAILTAGLNTVGQHSVRVETPVLDGVIRNGEGYRVEFDAEIIGGGTASMVLHISNTPVYYWSLTDAGHLSFDFDVVDGETNPTLGIEFNGGEESIQVAIDNVVLSEDTPGTLTITAIQTQARGTRIPTTPATLYSGPAPQDMILIPLDPAIHGFGTAGQRVGMVEFGMPGGRGLSAIRAAVVRWTNPQ